MMRRVFWSEKAGADFQAALDYVRERNSQGAEAIIRKVSQTVALLAERPHGRPGRVAGTYEKAVTGILYIIAYKLDDTAPEAPALWVLRVIHAARNWPPESWPE